MYHVMWSKLVLAAAIGFTYATVAPLSILFVLAYLGVAYVLYARSLLFSYSHEARRATVATSAPRPAAAATPQGPPGSLHLNRCCFNSSQLRVILSNPSLADLELYQCTGLGASDSGLWNAGLYDMQV